MPFLPLFRSALRPLTKRPAYSLIVIAGLAIGIGANTAIFSLVHGVLLEALPYERADRLVTVWEDHSLRNGPEDEWTGFSTFRDWRQQSTSFEALAAYSGWAPNIGTGADGAEPEQLRGLVVSEGWFRVFATPPLHGRSFAPEDDLPNAERVAIVSHSLWQRRLGADPAAVGEKILLDDQPTTIVGVLPASHEPLIAGTEVWRTLRFDPARNDRGAYFLQIVGRLGDGVELGRAEEDLERITASIAATEPAHYEDVGITLISLHDRLVGNAKPALFALSGAVALLLLVTCANVANLLLVSAVGRRQELAVRAGLGASRGQLIGRLLAESAVLAGIGGAAGLILAAWGTKILVAMAPAGTPRIEEVAMNGSVALFALGLSVLTGLAFGVVPAIRGSRIDLASTLRPGGRVESAGQSRLRGVLVVAEAALALCLLVGAGLLAKSFYGLTRVDVGFDSTGIVSTSVQLPAARYEERQERIDFYDRLLTALAERPEVDAIAATTSMPMAGAGSDFTYYVEGTPPAEEGHRPSAWYRMVTPDYFSTLGIQLLDGRGFDRSHHLEAPKAIIVSKRFAERWFGDETPIGRRMKMGGHDSERDWMTIIGVVADVRDRSPMLPTRDDVYLPHGQWGNRALAMAIAHDGASATALPLLSEVVDQELKRLDPALSSSSAVLLSDRVSNSLWLPRLAGQVLGVFALAALALAALGLYGVLSQTVQGRRREMGIRAALGATRRDIVGLILRQGLAMAGLGVALGTALALLSSRVLDSLLYGVEARDPAIFALMAGCLLGTAILAAWLPARSASETDPAVSLRQD